MKQISEVEENPFTSSLNTCPEADVKKTGGVGEVMPNLFANCTWIFNLKTT
jgi:hypothetical protein